jgi:hypothetical protein
MKSCKIEVPAFVSPIKAIYFVSFENLINPSLISQKDSSEEHLENSGGIYVHPKKKKIIQNYNIFFRNFNPLNKV